MDSGGFNRVISIERGVRVGTKSIGDPNIVWQAYLPEIFVEVSVVRGREHFDPGTRQRFSEDVYLFRCHYHDILSVDATMRVVGEDGELYDIKSMRPDEENRQDCIIECTRQDATVGAVALMGYIDDLISDGQANEAYEGFSVKAKGGTAPYTFSVAAGALPAGLSLDGSSGSVSGTPTVPGSSTVTFSVSDDSGAIHAMPSIIVTIAA